MRKSRWLFSIFSWVISCSGFAAEALYELEVKADPYQQFDIPKELFNVTQLKQGGYGLFLKDFVVVDAEGGFLPYAIYKQPAHSAASTLEKLDLPVYRVNTQAEQPIVLQGSEVRIQGSLIEVKTSADVKYLDRHSNTYLVDLREIKVPISSLEVDWLQADSTVNQWKLSGSNNFTSWEIIGTFDLARMTNANSQLIQNTLPVALGVDQFKFLKLEPANTNVSEITRITARYSVGVNKPEPSIDYWNLNGKALGVTSSVSRYRNGKVVAWEFLREESVPASQLMVDMGTYNYSGNLSVFVKNESTDVWYPFYSGYWMNALVGNELRRPSAIVLPNNAMKYWRVELDAETHLSSLALQFGWEPLLVRVVGNNKSPYRIMIKRQEFDAQKLFHQVVDNENTSWQSVRLKSLHEIGPLKNLNGRHYKTWIFWLSMLTAVLLLGYFSFRLMQQLKRKPF